MIKKSNVESGHHYKNRAIFMSRGIRGKKLNLIRFFCIVVPFFIATNCYSQTFGFKAGLNLSEIDLVDNTVYYAYDVVPSYTSQMLPGFHAGVIAEFPISGVLSFEPEMMFSTQGYKREYEMGSSKMVLNYINMPLNMKTTFDVGKTSIYGTFGPYFGLGLSGKNVYNFLIDGRSETHKYDIKWGDNEDGFSLKRFDFGLAFGAGVEIKSILIDVSYQLGLTNMEANPVDGNKMSNRVLGLSVGYKLH